MQEATNLCEFHVPPLWPSKAQNSFLLPSHSWVHVSQVTWVWSRLELELDSTVYQGYCKRYDGATWSLKVQTQMSLDEERSITVVKVKAERTNANTVLKNHESWQICIRWPTGSDTEYKVCKWWPRKCLCFRRLETLGIVVKSVWPALFIPHCTNAVRIEYAVITIMDCVNCMQWIKCIQMLNFSTFLSQVVCRIEALSFHTEVLYVLLCRAVTCSDNSLNLSHQLAHIWHMRILFEYLNYFEFMFVFLPQNMLHFPGVRPPPLHRGRSRF